MKYFSFEDEARRLLSEAKSFEERACARTTAAARALLAAVKRQGWSMLHRGDRLNPSVGERIVVVGITPVSQQDLEVLESLVETGRGKKIRIYVFSFDECSTIEELALFLPGVSPVMRSPVLVEYEHGAPVRWAEGGGAIDWARRL